MASSPAAGAGLAYLINRFINFRHPPAQLDFRASVREDEQYAGILGGMNMTEQERRKKRVHAHLTREQVVEALPLSIVRARESVMGSFRSVLHNYSLTEPQWRVIWTIESLEEVEMTELARMTAILFPSLSRIVRDLEQR